MRHETIAIWTAVCALATPLVDGPPAAAAVQPVCQLKQAAAQRLVGDRYSRQADHQDAARAYDAALRLSAGCKTTGGAMLAARVAAQAGTADAQNGDLLSALALLQSAQVRLKAIAVSDPHAAADAQAYGERVQAVISAIDDVAKSSM